MANPDVTSAMHQISLKCTFWKVSSRKSHRTFAANHRDGTGPKYKVVVGVRSVVLTYNLTSTKYFAHENSKTRT